MGTVNTVADALAAAPTPADRDALLRQLRRWALFNATVYGPTDAHSDRPQSWLPESPAADPLTVK